MKNALLFLIIVSLVVSITGCGGASVVDSGDIPEWYLNTPEDPNYLFAPSTATSKDLQLAVDKATTDGRAEIARQVETKVQSMQKQFSEEVGVGDNSTLLQQFTQATKTVVSESLSGSKILNKEVVKEGALFRSYVLVQYPIGAANDAFMQQIKKNEELYTRFRSSQAFEDLDKEVKKYEEWKDKQGQ